MIRSKDDEIIWIVAGNKKEFEDFVIRKRMMGFHFNYRYVASADVLRGLSRIRGFYIGTYDQRLDWKYIDQTIKMIKANGG